MIAPQEKTVAGFFEGLRGVAVDDAKIVANYKSAILRGWPEHGWVRPHGTEAIICGGGPSMKDRATLNKIRRMSDRGAVVCAVNMTHDHLLALPKKKLGPAVEPDICVLLDPKPVVAGYVHPIKGPLYFIASQCDPATLDTFEAPGVHKFLYHHEAACLSPLLSKSQHVTPPVFSTVGLESILVLYRLGFRKFHLFGLESSYSAAELHAYEKPVKYTDRVNVRAADPTRGISEDFVTNAHMACQAEDFRTFALFWSKNVMPGGYERIEITVHGEGYLPASAKILNNQFDWIRHASSIRERVRREYQFDGKGDRRSHGKVPPEVRQGQSHQLQ